MPWPNVPTRAEPWKIWKQSLIEAADPSGYIGHHGHPDRSLMILFGKI